LGCTESEYRTLIRPALGTDEATVTLAQTGFQLVTLAVEALLHPGSVELPSLIIVTRNLPQLSGLDAVTRIRRCGMTMPAVLLCSIPEPDPYEELQVTTLMKADCPRALADYLEHTPFGDPRSSGVRPCMPSGVDPAGRRVPALGRRAG
jgi:CheY-like chemotaxis protein